LRRNCAGREGEGIWRDVSGLFVDIRRYSSEKLFFSEEGKGKQQKERFSSEKHLFARGGEKRVEGFFFS